MTLELVIRARPRDIGAFAVRRALPAAQRRMVGPFIFFDHMGPVDLPPGAPMTVRPHPHIGLSTVTYLFEGEIHHRDSLGSSQIIRPGDVNLMVAGRGIVHSERGTEAQRERGGRMHGIQLWLAMPTESEDCEPRFLHHPGATIPKRAIGDAEITVVIGTAFGETSPVETHSPTLYVDVSLASGTALELPVEHDNLAAYVVEGEVDVDGEPLEVGALGILERPRAAPREDQRAAILRARGPSRVMLLGGASLAGERHLYWNFVASDPARIEAAKARWKARGFPIVPGDEIEFIPLPD